MTTIEKPTAVGMMIHTADITFEAIGYPGWVATVRTNPRQRVYDDFVSQDEDKFWQALAQVVLEWNLADEDGVPMPLPRDGLTPQDLPANLLLHLVREYIDAVNAPLLKVLSPRNGESARGD